MLLCIDKKKIDDWSEVFEIIKKNLKKEFN